MSSIREQIVAAQSIVPQAVTATVNGSGVDLKESVDVLVLINLGTFAGTTPTATIEIEDSDDDTTFAAVAAGFLTGGGQLAEIDTTNDAQVYERGYVGIKRFLRVAVTAIAGASASLPMAASVVRRAKVQPV